MFDTATGVEVCRPIGEVRPNFAACFAADGNEVALADQTVALFDWPPRPRWPLMLALSAPTIMLCCDIGFWWSQRRPGMAKKKTEI